MSTSSANIGLSPGLAGPDGWSSLPRLRAASRKRQDRKLRGLVRSEADELRPIGGLATVVVASSDAAFDAFHLAAEVVPEGIGDSVAADDLALPCGEVPVAIGVAGRTLRIEDGAHSGVAVPIVGNGANLGAVSIGCECACDC
jgi:hypothetical protein